MPTSNRHFLVASLLAALPFASPAFACDSGANVIFGCEAAKGKKYIELCASNPVTEDGYLQYRFGALDEDGNDKSVEFEFPAEREGSLKRFFGATYKHQGVYTQSVRFATPTYSYAVYTKTRGSEDVGAGVEVRNLASGKTTTVACSERPRFYIDDLKDVLACDPETPAGKACIR